MTASVPISGNYESIWTVIRDPGTAGFSVAGVPDDWARTDHLRVDGLPVTAWLPRIRRQSGFAPNALLAAWTATVTTERIDDLLSALGVVESTDGPILMDPPVVLTNTVGFYAQQADAVVQSPFGPLSSRVWHSVRRDHADRVSMGRLTVTVTRPDAYLLDEFRLLPRWSTPDGQDNQSVHARDPV